MSQWEPLTRLKLQLMGRIGSQDISLMQPEGSIVYAQIPGRFIERRNGVRRVENYFEHSNV